MNVMNAGILFAGGLALGVLILLEAGRRLRRRQEQRLGDGTGEGMGAVEGAAFGILGLLMAFTFSGAATRFDARRQLVIEEANAISTAYLRLDMLPQETRANVRELFRQYVDARLELYRAVPDSALMNAALGKLAGLQADIWSRAATSVHVAPVPAVAFQSLPTINLMFDLANTRRAVTRIHPPAMIYALLVVVSLLSALLAGYDMGKAKWRSWFHMVILSATLAITLYVIVDLEFPRFGLIKVTDFDQLLIDARANMK